MAKKHLSVLTFENLKKKIILGELQPGAILNEREIAESLGVSRTPVREAIQRLLQEGWAVAVNGKGIRVSTVTARDVEEVLQVRKLIENHAITYLFKEGEPKVLAGHLYRVLSEMKKNVQDLRNFIRLDLEFHNLIIRSSGNSRIIKLWAAIHDELTRFFMFVLVDLQELPEITEEHEMFISALWNQDQVKCLQIMGQHHKRNYTSLLERVMLTSR